MTEPIRILMLEDAPEDAELTQRQLRKAGLAFVVQVVETREDFLAALEEFAPDLVLSDHSLPNMDGVTALKLTREHLSEVPFIFVSGSLGEERAIEMLRNGATDYVLKDRPSRLLPAVRRALEEAREREQRRRAEDALVVSEERYALAVRGANDGIYDWDIRSSRAYFSERWRAIIGEQGEASEAAPDEWLGRIHADDAARVKAQLDLHLQAAGPTPHFESEHRIQHEDGSYRWVLVRGRALRDADGRACRLAGSMTDITDRKRAEEQLAFSAFYDVLTGLPNRLLFIDRLTRSLHPSRRKKDRKVAALLIDLDRFKIINDSLGHTAGDELLVKVARKLENCARSEDTVARLGGDEFAILLDEVEDITGASRVAEAVHREMSTTVLFDGSPVVTTASIGLVLGRPGCERPEEVLRDADTALYRAKGLGRARTEIFDPSMAERAQALMRIESGLGRAVERGEIAVVYQPILSLETGSIVGCEALVRWMHPERGLVMPAEFIPVAEETGAIVPIGSWVLREACLKTRSWLDKGVNGHPMTVSVNLSAKQFREKDLYGMIARTLDETGLPHDRLKLEVTESAVMDDPESAARILRDLTKLGIRFSLDDFGTGYSALAYLRAFPFSCLKIDRSFVTEITTEADAAAIAAAIVNLAHSLKMSVVAEGIETEPQRHFLQSLRCDEGQGYLFGRPMSASAMEELITNLASEKRG